MSTFVRNQSVVNMTIANVNTITKGKADHIWAKESGLQSDASQFHVIRQRKLRYSNYSNPFRLGNTHSSGQFDSGFRQRLSVA